LREEIWLGVMHSNKSTNSQHNNFNSYFVPHFWACLSQGFVCKKCQTILSTFSWKFRLILKKSKSKRESETKQVKDKANIVDFKIKDFLHVNFKIIWLKINFRTHFITSSFRKFYLTLVCILNRLVFVWPSIYNNSKNRSLKRWNNKRVAYFLKSEPPGTE
jgi:hypothetical protein